MGLDMYIYTNSKKMSQHLNKDDDYDMRNGIAAYWRKANAIHRWLVDHVQDGRDDCGYYEVGVDQLRELLDAVNEVLASTRLVDGMVNIGMIYNGREFIDRFADGKVLEDPSVAKVLLPTQGGFFFGSIDYDESYWQDLIDTREALGRILECVELPDDDWSWHFKGEDDWNLTLTYHASW